MSEGEGESESTRLRRETAAASEGLGTTAAENGLGGITEARIRADPSVFREAIALIQAGDRRAMRVMVRAHDGACRMFARRYTKNGCPADYLDALQEARMGVLEGCQRYKLAEFADKKPLTYVLYWARSRALRYVQNLGFVVRRPIFHYDVQGNRKRAPLKPVAINLSDLREDPHDGEAEGRELDFPDLDNPAAEEAVEAFQIEGKVKPVLARLMAEMSPRERVILRNRWATEEPQPVTLLEIGAAMDPPLSRERVRQIEANAFDQMRLETALAGARPRAHFRWVTDRAMRAYLAKPSPSFEAWVAALADSLDGLEDDANPWAEPEAESPPAYILHPD